MSGPDVVGAEAVPPASPGGALGPQGGAAAWPTTPQRLSGAGARKAPSTERSPTRQSHQSRGNRSQDEKATGGWESLQTTHQPKGVSFQHTQELLQFTSKNPNNPIPDGLKMSTDVSPGQVLSLPDHQGDAGQSTAMSHLSRDGSSGGQAAKNPPCRSEEAGSVPGQGTEPPHTRESVRLGQSSRQTQRRPRCSQMRKSVFKEDQTQRVSQSTWRNRNPVHCCGNANWRSRCGTQHGGASET